MAERIRMKAIYISLLLIPSLSIAAGEAEQAAPSESSQSDESIPTRFLADNLDDHIATMRARLAINKQERGPFGLYQIPGKAPIITGNFTKKARKTPFTEFINQIEISVINAQEKEFLVGARIFRLGQVFPIVRGGDKLSVQVVSVTPSKVLFKNLQSGETAARRLDILPAGISTAGGKIEIRGVTPNNRREAEPLRLDFNSSLPTP